MLQRKLQYGCTSAVPRMHKRRRYFEKFTSCMTWCAQTCSFRAIFGLPMRSLTTDASAIVRCRKNYIGAHLRSWH